MIVRLFQPEFARLVESGLKCQTIRPTPNRMPGVGDRISLREWTGRPYRSKQRVLREATITDVANVIIRPDRVILNGFADDSPLCLNAFARLDGFDSWNEMAEWFDRMYGLPFRGILICWDNE